MINPKFKLAILFNPHELHPPSNLRTLRYVKRIGKKHNVLVTLVALHSDFNPKDYDGVFIRTEPFIGNEAYWIACKTYKLGVPLDDDPLSIIQSTDKAYMHGVFDDNGVKTPDTTIIESCADAERIIELYGFPLVIKIPNGSFSKGVYKVTDEEMLTELLDKLFRNSKRLVAQRWTPTDFDWRVGCIGGKPLYVCKYYMAPDHWQIVKHLPKGILEGDGETLSLENAPKGVISAALKAAALVGNGLYGVDLKQVGNDILVIEVNDNPTIEHGIEDQQDPEGVWIKIFQWFKDQR